MIMRNSRVVLLSAAGERARGGVAAEHLVLVSLHVVAVEVRPLPLSVRRRRHHVTDDVT
jgi:hypothetical protein